jgi:hypothetical protein
LSALSCTGGRHTERRREDSVDLVGVGGLIVGVAGTAVGAASFVSMRSKRRERARDQKEAWKEIQSIYSLAKHLEYWVTHPTTTDGLAHGTNILGQIHLLMIALKNAGTRYSKQPLVPTSPFPEAPAQFEAGIPGKDISPESPVPRPGQTP